MTPPAPLSQKIGDNLWRIGYWWRRNRCRWIGHRKKLATSISVDGYMVGFLYCTRPDCHYREGVALD